MLVISVVGVTTLLELTKQFNSDQSVLRKVNPSVSVVPSSFSIRHSFVERWLQSNRRLSSCLSVSLFSSTNASELDLSEVWQFTDARSFMHLISSQIWNLPIADSSFSSAASTADTVPCQFVSCHSSNLSG